MKETIPKPSPESREEGSSEDKESEEITSLSAELELKKKGKEAEVDSEFDSESLETKLSTAYTEQTQSKTCASRHKDSSHSQEASTWEDLKLRGELSQEAYKELGSV